MSVMPAALEGRPSGKASEAPSSPAQDDLDRLLMRWRGRTRFVVQETGFGLGKRFLATWSAWLADVQRCDRLVFIAIENQPPTTQALGEAHNLNEAAAPSLPEPTLARRLVDTWPTLTPGFHTLNFDEPLGPRGALQGVTLMLGLGEVADLLPTLMAEVDAFYLDTLAPAKGSETVLPKWLSRLNRLAAPQATAITGSSASGVQDSLTQAGFRVEPLPDADGPMPVTRATYAPRHTPAPQAGGVWAPAPPADRHAIVVGAGLAGCSAAWALCREGWRVTLIDQHDGPAQEGSGNPGGLFHSVLHGDDGIHARAHRAAALATWRQVQPWMAAGELAGQCEGLLRLDGKTLSADAQALLARLGLPKDHVQWLDVDAARAIAGVPVPSGGWLYQQGGWLHPAGYATRLLQDAQAWRGHEQEALLTCLWRHTIARIVPTEHGWEIHDSLGHCIAQAPSLVLANAHQAQTLLTTLPHDRAVAPLPLSRVRGQISAWPGLDGQRPAVSLPRLPVAGSGYVLPLRDDCLLFGATTQHHDEDPAVREADHRHNLKQAARLGTCPDHPADAPLPAALQGRTGWRATTPDRLPLIGALPWSDNRLTQAPARTRLDQVRLIPRERTERGGLYVASGLGSRGITWTALAGALLAHWVTGSPCPIESDLRDALDPARFLSRAHRH